MALSMVQQTDTTFAVDGAEYVDVETLGGSITVEVWDEDRIRVQAEHSARTYVEIDRHRNGISIESEARRGPANLVDFVLTVPRRLTLRLEANYGDIVIDGSDGEVNAETVQGDVTVRGGRGQIEIESTVGSIFVEGADGTIEIESSAADIRIEDSSGEIYAETAGGSIVLENVDPRVVDVGSTGGRVYYSGSFRRGGTYFFGAHGGSITIVVPEGASASFNVATVHGSITSTLDGEPRAFRGGERHQFEVGEGGALVEAETYGGRIRLLRPGTEGAEAPARRVRDRDARLSHGGAGSHPGLGWVDPTPRVTAAVTPWVTAAVEAAVTPRVTVDVSTAVEAQLGPLWVHVPRHDHRHDHREDPRHDERHELDENDCDEPTPTRVREPVDGEAATIR